MVYYIFLTGNYIFLTGKSKSLPFISQEGSHVNLQEKKLG